MQKCDGMLIYLVLQTILVPKNDSDYSDRDNVERGSTGDI